MIRKAIVAPVMALGLLLAAACSTGANAEHHVSAAGSVSGSDAAIKLRMDMRKMWEDHITWTRLYIVSAAAGLKDEKVAAERLLRNQDDIGNAIKPYYGEQAGAELTLLLREHILTAANLLSAAKKSDTAGVEKAKKAWYDNADQIAGLLSSANQKNWPKDVIAHHMTMHLDLTLEEAVARLTGKFVEDVAAYDKVHDAILEMSDVLAAGIVAQFPDRFGA